MKKQVSKNKKYNSVQRSLPIYRRPWFLICLAVLVVAAIALAIFLLTHNSASQDATPNDNTTGSVPTSTSPQGANAEAINDKDLETAASQTPAQYEGPDPNTLDEITGFVSYAAVNDDHLSIRLTIDQYLAAVGTCDLTMTSGAQTVTKTAPTFTDAATSSCEGFDVPLADLPSGTWNINIKINADGKTGTITGETSL